MTEVTFKADLVAAILNYLGARPYQEVEQLVGAMRQQINESAVKQQQATTEVQSNG